MSKEPFQDQPVNHEAIVGSYTPEMVQARDTLKSRLTMLKEQAKAAEAAGTLPPRVKVHTFEESGAVVVTLGDFSENFQEALAQYQADKILGAIALELDGTGLSGSEMMVITFHGEDYRGPEDTVFLGLDEPAVKVEWGDQHDDEATRNVLSVYHDGYVESGSGITSMEWAHPPDASELVQAYAKPTIRYEVDILPLRAQPAELGDIQNAAVQIDNTCARYGVNY